ncbi:MAG TPA: hypothetical protein VM598_00840 [Bdellovibrionota bacterium]|nr:hypothetical protein [Bdellovibrionota bacterium]
MMMIRKLCAGAILGIAVLAGPSPAAASGELTLLPGYFFNAEKFNLLRVGLYVQEPLAERWTYTSWSGSGRTYLNDPNVSQVTWYSTQHSVNYGLVEGVTVGGGVGYEYSTPSNYSNIDLHLRIGVRLW